MPCRFRRLVCLVLVLCSASPAATAAASTRPGDAELLGVVDGLVVAMNAGSDREIAALLTRDAVMQDEVPPYRWLGPSAEAKWSRDDSRLAAQRGVSDRHSPRGTPTYVHRSGNHAFLTVPLVYTYRVHGRPQRETGLWTVVMVRSAAAWKIALLGFAKVSDTSDATWNGPQP